MKESVLSTAGVERSTSQVVREPLITTRDLLLWLYLYPLQSLFKFTSRDWLYRISRIAEPLLQLHFRKWRKRAEARMLATPGSGISASEAPRIARQLVSNAMFRLLDDVVISRPEFLKELRVSEVSGLEHVESAAAQRKGVVIVIGHFSAVRVARRYLAAIGYPMLTVRAYRPNAGGAGRLSGRFVQPRLAKVLHEVVRDEADPRTPDCTLKILQRLRSGGLVSITMDAPGGARHVEVPLLGAPSRFSTGLLDIIRLSGCAVVPMLCLGRSSDLRIVFSPPLDIVQSSSRDDFIGRNLPTFVKCLEKQIEDHPAEWVLWALL